MAEPPPAAAAAAAPSPSPSSDPSVSTTAAGPGRPRRPTARRRRRRRRRRTTTAAATAATVATGSAAVVVVGVVAPRPRFFRASSSVVLFAAVVLALRSTTTTVVPTAPFASAAAGAGGNAAIPDAEEGEEAGAGAVAPSSPSSSSRKVRFQKVADRIIAGKEEMTRLSKLEKEEEAAERLAAAAAAPARPREVEEEDEEEEASNDDDDAAAETDGPLILEEGIESFAEALRPRRGAGGVVDDVENSGGRPGNVLPPPTLMLLAIHSPRCDRCRALLSTLKEVSETLEDDFASFLETTTYTPSWGTTTTTTTKELRPPLPPPPPIVGAMDGAAVGNDWLKQFAPMGGYPTLKFVLGRVRPSSGSREGEEEEPRPDGEAEASVGGDEGEAAAAAGPDVVGDGDRLSGPTIEEGPPDEQEDGANASVPPPPMRPEMDIVQFPYVGPRGTPKEICDVAIRKWYRFVVAASLRDDRRRRKFSDSIGGDEGGGEGGDDDGGEDEDESVDAVDDDEDEEEYGDDDDVDVDWATEPPVFELPSLASVTAFLEAHGRPMLRPAPPQLDPKLNEIERRYALSIVDSPAGTAEAFVFVQCRSSASSDFDRDDDENDDDDAPPLDPYDEFGSVAAEAVNRPDVAFFAVDDCGVADGDDDVGRRFVDGEVFAARLSGPTGGGGGPGDAVVRWDVPDPSDAAFFGFGATYVPTSPTPPPSSSSSDADEDDAADRNETSRSSSTRRPSSAAADGALAMPPPPPSNAMAQFFVDKSTPTVLWYDRRLSGPIAFATHRKVHAVLFVDLHRVFPVDDDTEEEEEEDLDPDLDDGFDDDDDGDGDEPWEEDDDEEEDATADLARTIHSESKEAVRRFRDAALRHRRDRPADDAVFLVVPSTETRMLDAMGIDVWSPLDEEATRAKGGRRRGNDERRGGPDGRTVERRPLPTLLVTDRREETGGFGVRRHYLDARDVLRPTTTTTEEDDGGVDDENPIARFLSDFWSGHLRPTLQSEFFPAGFDVTNESGVRTLTGRTFHARVTERADRHALVHFHSPTCGHCKRFNVLWNEFARLVKFLGWDDFLDVMKMDITKNEVTMHGGDGGGGGGDRMLDVRDVPAMYCFPRGAKNRPVRYGSSGGGRGKEGNDAEVGDLGSPLDIVSWFLDVVNGEEETEARLDESELLRLLEGADEEGRHERDNDGNTGKKDAG